MVSKVARVAALMIGGSVLVAGPAWAQRVEQRQPDRTTEEAPTAGEPVRTLSRPEQAAINPLLTAYNAADAVRAAGQTPDWAPVRQLLPAAQAAARGNDARYLVSRVQLGIAATGTDIPAQETALNALLTNPATPPSETATYRTALAGLMNVRAERAFAANDFTTAERIFRELLQANPSDTRLQNNLRIVMERMGNSAGALQGIEQQITAAEANGGRASEALYRQAADSARRARQRPAALSAIKRLVSAYPTQGNWRMAIDFARELPTEDTQLLIDIYRLARAANTLQPTEYAPLANTLAQASYYAEAQAVLDAGTASGALTASDPTVARVRTAIGSRLAQDRAGLTAEIREARGSGTARQARNVGDALLGYARYAEAAELYRVAATKGGEDANLLNTRLGIALALAGQRADAETAFRAVTGQRAEVAALWLAWLARSAT